MKLCVKIIPLIFFLTLAYSPEYAGKTWHSKKASEKIQELENRVEADASTPGWYSAQLAEIFVEGMTKTFESVMDDMPAQNLFNLEERPKLIHSVGAVATMRWTPVKTKYNYTGIFTSGCEGFIRLSLAKQPDSTPSNDSLILPGAAFKLMRDGHPSASIFAMYSLVGQSSYNFFEHDLSNHVPNIDPSKAGFATSLLYKTFLQASKWPTMLGLRDMASIGSQGQTYATPRFPYRLIFHPTTSVHSHIPSTKVAGDYFFVQQLEDSYFEGDLFEVYAQPLPTSTPQDYVRLATITLLSTPTGSRWGDHDMFHQHFYMENDFEIYPQWQDGAAKNVKFQAANFPWHFPDLPFK